MRRSISFVEKRIDKIHFRRRARLIARPLIHLSVGLAVATPTWAYAPAGDLLSGRWTNSKNTVTVKLGHCGTAWCGVVIAATDKAKESARRGGTPQLIGTHVLSGVRRSSDGSFKGRAFDPKRNIHAAAIITMISPRVLRVKGCVFAGLICKEQQWTRVD